MRILVSSLLVLAHLLCLSSLGAALDTHRADVGLKVNNDVAENPNTSSDTTSASINSWASSLIPSHIVEGLQYAYLPPALHLTSAIQTLMAPEPSPSDFWEMAQKSENKLQEYVPRLLNNAAQYFKFNAFTDITSAMNNILHSTATFRESIQGALDAHNITLETLTEELEGICMTIVHDLENIPSPDKAPGHVERGEMIDKVLDNIEAALTDLASRYGIDKEIVTKYLNALRPHVHALTVAVGDINEQYPALFPSVAFSVAAMLIPESWILRPFLSILGFGPVGPVKGTAAAWMQRRFWGAAVKADSWFAMLQAAGMGVLPKWAWLVKAPLVVGGLFAMTCSYFGRGRAN